MDMRSWGAVHPAAQDLSKTPSFQFGPLAIDPPLRRVSVRGKSETLEPRVMRVLVALVEAEGSVLSRDDLVTLCWDGLIVGDNAINRVISRLRRVLADLTGGAVRLETITKVGFRLVEGSEAAEPGTSDTPKLHGRLLLFALLAGLVALSGVAWLAFDFGAATEAGSRRTEQRVSVLVRPFEASGTGDQTEAALATGITDELIIRLRRIPELQIATALADGSPSSSAFDDAHVVSGNVRSTGNHLRVTARIADPAGEILWSQSFESNLVDLFKIQQEIAFYIANALSVPLGAGENAASYVGTDKPEAYAAYLQSESLFYSNESELAIEKLEEAVRLDPNYQKAWTALVMRYGGLATARTDEGEIAALLKKMEEISRRALETRPELPTSHIARGAYLLARQPQDLLGAEARFQRAADLERNNNIEILAILRFYEVSVGRIEKGTGIHKMLTQIDPIHAIGRGQMNFETMNGNYPAAIDLFERWLAAYGPEQLRRMFPLVYWSYVLSGREDEAVTLQKQFGWTDNRRQVVNTHVRGKTLSQLRNWATKEFGAGGQALISDLALVAAHLGHSREAVDLLRIASERTGPAHMVHLWHPALAEVRKTEEFAQLLIDLGFVELWRQSGEWGDYCRPVSETKIECT